MKKLSQFPEGIQLLSFREQTTVLGGGQDEERNLLLDIGFAIGRFFILLWRTPPGDSCDECIPMMI